MRVAGMLESKDHPNFFAPLCRLAALDVVKRISRGTLAVKMAPREGTVSVVGVDDQWARREARHYRELLAAQSRAN